MSRILIIDDDPAHLDSALRTKVAGLIARAGDARAETRH